ALRLLQLVGPVVVGADARLQLRFLSFQVGAIAAGMAQQVAAAAPPRQRQPRQVAPRLLQTLALGPALWPAAAALRAAALGVAELEAERADLKHVLVDQRLIADAGAVDARPRAATAIADAETLRCAVEEAMQRRYVRRFQDHIAAPRPPHRHHVPIQR